MAPSTISAEKAEQRKACLLRRQALQQQVQAQFSQQICHHIYQFITQDWARTRPVSVVAVYAAMRGEVNLQDLASRLRAQGIRTAYPTCFSRREMTFYDVASEAEFQRSSFGVLEPVPAVTTKVEPQEIDLMCIPAVAFTHSGLRLGYGGGFYDKYLAQPQLSALRMGVGYSLQYVSTLPQEPFDCLLDCVATEKGIETCG